MNLEYETCPCFNARAWNSLWIFDFWNEPMLMFKITWDFETVIMYPKQAEEGGGVQIGFNRLYQNIIKSYVTTTAIKCRPKLYQMEPYYFLFSMKICWKAQHRYWFKQRVWERHVVMSIIGSWTACDLRAAMLTIERCTCVTKECAVN